jgi:hypothetical protein
MHSKRTTRAHVGALAVRLTCLLCLDICHLEGHHERNRALCLFRNPSAAPGAWNVNFDSVMLHLKKLDDWHPIGLGCYESLVSGT